MLLKIRDRCASYFSTSYSGLARHQKSGLSDAKEVLENVRGIAFIHFQSDDVVRHPLVARIVEAYEKRDKKPD